MKKVISKDKNITRLLGVLLAVFVLCTLLKPSMFLSIGNFQSMARQFPEFGLLAIGIGLTMLTGGIDLSAVSIANLSAIIAASFMIGNVPQEAGTFNVVSMLLIGCLLAVMVGCIAGCINGVLISKIGIPAILATLGTQQLFAGVAIVFTKGNAISGLPMAYSNFINQNILGIPVVLILFVLCAVVIGIVLEKTKTGRRLYLLGTNEQATKYTGLNNSRLFIFTYMLSGMLASVAGLIMMGRSNSAKADYGASYTLQCVLIAVLGGVSPKGGKGRVIGIVLAVIILQIMSSGLNMFENISNFYRDLIWGALLILVLIFNYVIDRNKAKA